MVRLHIPEKKGVTTFTVDATSGAVTEEKKTAWEEYAARLSDEQRKAFAVELVKPAPSQIVVKGAAVLEKDGHTVKRVRK